MDLINRHREQLREAIARLLGGSTNASDAREALSQLERANSGCVELALIGAAIRFFRESPRAGIESIARISKINQRSSYTVGCVADLNLHKIRALSAGDYSISGPDFINFIFIFNYLRQRFSGGSELSDWLSYEWAKQRKRRNYNNLYLLRNLTLSLGRGLLPSYHVKSISAQVDAMDEQLILLLKALVRLGKPKLREEGVRKIAICAGLLKHSEKAVHARLVFDYALSLATNYPDLRILIVNTNEIPFESPLYSYDMFRVSSVARKRLSALATATLVGEPGKRIQFNDVPLLNAGAWQDLLVPIQRVIEFDPDVIMHFGAKHHNESFFARRVLYDWCPTAYFFSQMNNGVDKYNDIYLARNAYRLVGSYDPSRVRVAPPPVRPEVLRPTAEHKPHRYAWSEVKSNTEEVTLISVMAGYRMARFFRHYSAALRAQMMALLDESNVRWIWLGPDNAEELLAIDREFLRHYQEGSLEIRNFDPNLGAIYDHCDLFLHLPHFTGGGGGVMLALEHSLPVLCFENSDASTFVLPECVFAEGDVGSYFAKAMMLVRDRSLRAQIAQRTAEHYGMYSTEGVAERSYNALLEAVSFYNKRVDAQIGAASQKDK